MGESTSSQTFTVTPTVQRDQIESHGIKPIPGVISHVNLFSTRERAQRWAQAAVDDRSFRSSPAGTADIWLVDVNDLEIERIDDNSGFPDRLFEGAVAPSRLTLLATL